MLFDSDDSTCLTVVEDFTLSHQPTSLIIHWDTNEKNSPRDDAATYYCQPEFFVNVTHGLDVDLSVQTGHGIVTNGNLTGTVLKYEQCSLIGNSLIQGLIRSRFVCQCMAKCNVKINIKVDKELGTVDDRLCSLKIYD